MRRLALLTLAAALIVAAPAAAASSKTKYVVSLGDSFSAGVQPGPGVSQSFSYPKVSYANQMLSRASKLLHTKLKLEMLACGGATTASMVGAEIKRCDPGVSGFKLPYANTSPRTSQLRYATQFLREHRGQVAFVTMTMGGNDLLRCVDSATGGFDLNCITSSYGAISNELPKIAARIRAAAGRDVPVLGAGYYDPVPGVLPARPGPAGAGAGVAGDRVAAERDAADRLQEGGLELHQPRRRLRHQHPAGPDDEPRPLRPGPVAVAMVCEMSWMCAPRAAGAEHPSEPGRVRGVRVGPALRAEEGVALAIDRRSWGRTQG